MAKNDDKAKPDDGPVVDAEKEMLLAETATLETENADLQAKIDQLEKKNAELLAELKKPVVNIKGFALEPDDPFAAGAVRVYVSTSKAKQTQRPILPFVLPYYDKPATKEALRSYIVRAAGGGDNKRADAARAVLKKL